VTEILDAVGLTEGFWRLTK